MEGNSKRRYNLLEWITAIILMVILAVTFANVVGRYIANSPIFWSDELNTNLFVWLTFLGSAIAVSTNEHMSISFFFNKLPTKLQMILKYVGIIITIITFCYLVVQGVMATMALKDQRLSSLPFSRAWSFAPIPIGFSVMIYFLIIKNVFKNKGGL
ncbi:TRAP transporter small permease [Oceanobacillus sp. CFH 90083]|uniref:TRAP transporter small permease n=1 Tax=Oceanobacillus sp. CFH 90083 TaxID=2592336 RepID=UPI00128D31ED|nr:TRAP transporter small permease [Oceanobacillus sp. CFH 90083]